MATNATDDGTNSAHQDGPYSGLPNKLVRAANGIGYAYRDTGPGASGGVPLVLFQHHTEFATDVEAFLADRHQP